MANQYVFPQVSHGNYIRRGFGAINNYSQDGLITGHSGEPDSLIVHLDKGSQKQISAISAFGGRLWGSGATAAQSIAPTLMRLLVIKNLSSPLDWHFDGIHGAIFKSPGTNYNQASFGPRVILKNENIVWDEMLSNVPLNIFRQFDDPLMFTKDETATVVLCAPYSMQTFFDDSLDTASPNFGDKFGMFDDGVVAGPQQIWGHYMFIRSLSVNGKLC